MADKKISQLTAATTPLAGSEVLPIVQSSTTVKVSVADVTKGRTIQTTGINDNNNNEVITITTTASAVNELTIANAATGANPVISATGSDTNIGITLTPKGTGNAVLTSGNLVVANGNGIDFSATPGTGTSELFADYEEGIWTPTIEGTTSAGTGTYVVQSGRYTKIGNRVFFDCNVVWSAHTGTGDMFLVGWPFTPALVFRAIPAVTWDITQTGGKAPCIVFGSGSFLKANIAEYGNSGAYANIAMDTAGQILVNGSYEI